MRRGFAGGLTARLMYAGWDRSSATRRKVPWTKNARGCGHSLNGGQFCGGGAPAHGGVLALAQRVPGASGKMHVRRCLRGSGEGVDLAVGRRGGSRWGRKTPGGSP